jgi:glycosyltransferase involved in cell wall biosynthesis
MKMEEERISWRINRLKLCIIVPAFNNAGTLAAVIEGILNYTDRIIVVDDGSTDGTGEILKGYDGLCIISYRRNMGKGHALRCGFDMAERLHYRHAISMDADGQHTASDIVNFVDMIERNPGTFIAGRRLVEGERPAGSRLANRLSNFWVHALTLSRRLDAQNGFRLYPLCRMNGLRPFFNRYEAELELIVRCAWKGIRILPAATRVYYPPKKERVSHFRPGTDFMRIAGVHVLFIFLSVVYGYPSLLYHRIIRRGS